MTVSLSILGRGCISTVSPLNCIGNKQVQPSTKRFSQNFQWCLQYLSWLARNLTPKLPKKICDPFVLTRIWLQESRWKKMQCATCKKMKPARNVLHAAGECHVLCVRCLDMHATGMPAVQRFHELHCKVQWTHGYRMWDYEVHKIEIGMTACHFHSSSLWGGEGHRDSLAANSWIIVAVTMFS